MALAASNFQSGEIQDTAWVRQALFVPGNSSKKANSRARDILRSQQYSDSSLVFADTSLGGNRSINPRPQFTKNADPSLNSLLSNTTSDGTADSISSMGMGRAYAERIDNPAQRIYMQFGVPAFNSLTNFFTGYYDRSQGDMANTGRVNDILYTISKYIGYVVLWPVTLVLGISNLVYKAYRSATNKPLSRYYYMNQTMTLYWNTVTTIVNAISVNMGLAQGVTPDDVENVPGKEPNVTGTTTPDVAILNRLLPDIMRSETGGIDIRAVANRYQRLSDAHDRAFADILEKAGSEAEATKAIAAYMNKPASGYDVPAKSLSLGEYSKQYSESPTGTGEGLTNRLNEDVPADVDNSAAPVTSTANINSEGTDTTLTEYFSKLFKFAAAESRDGSKFVSFIVDHQATVSESFSTTTKSSDIAATMNETSSNTRNKVFNLAGGNLGDNPILGAVEVIMSGVGSIIGGLAESVHLQGLSAIAGKAFVDMPEFLDSSTTTLPSNSYTIQLRTPYGNPYSILTNIYVPLAMLLAGVTPRSTGKNSYTSPFLCKLWSKGRSQVQMGAITDMTITRGTGNVGWSVKDQTLGVDVTFTVTNLSKMLHMPISNEVSLADTLGFSQFDEDNNFTDYMAVLGSLGLSEQYYPDAKWRLKRARAKQNFDSWLSISNFAAASVDSTPGRLISAFVRGANI